MATGGNGKGQYSDTLGSEDLDELKCHPCHEDGTLREAVGICLDCQDYLCQRCFDSHTIPKPCRQHQLLDKKQMLQSKVQLQRQDKCTQKCLHHDDEVIKYYCTEHGQLGCSVCLSLDHRTCKAVQYIPHAAKDLANNKEFKQVENQFNSLFEQLNHFLEKSRQNGESVENMCSGVQKMVETYRKNIIEALDEIQTDMIEKVEAIKSKRMEQITLIIDKYQGTQRELQRAKSRIDALQKSNQNCDLYSDMIKMKDKLNVLEEEMKKAERGQSLQVKHIRFSPNQELTEMLKKPGAFGKLYDIGEVAIVRAELVQDINVKTNYDTEECSITGSALLSDKTLVIADYNNQSVKAIDVKQNQVITQIQLSNKPFDVSTVSENQVAVTLPLGKKIAFVTVGNTMSVDRTLHLDGKCTGLDCVEDKLAVSYRDPHKVQILNLQGAVIHDITTDPLGKALFNTPFHVVFSQDVTKLHVSNFKGNSVLSLRFDGTVVTSYTDRDLKHPRKIFVDGGGMVYVCAAGSDCIHQLTPAGEKVRLLLRKADGLATPQTLSYSEAYEKFYVGMYNSNIIKVYKASFGPL